MKKILALQGLDTNSETAEIGTFTAGSSASQEGQFPLLPQQTAREDQNRGLQNPYSTDLDKWGDVTDNTVHSCWVKANFKTDKKKIKIKNLAADFRTLFD